jgi:hypothetical protein
VSLDRPEELAVHLAAMLDAGARAHVAASEEGGRTGPVRDLLFGLNTVVEALIALIEEREA